MFLAPQTEFYRSTGSELEKAADYWRFNKIHDYGPLKLETMLSNNNPELDIVFD